MFWDRAAGEGSLRGRGDSKSIRGEQERRSI